MDEAPPRAGPGLALLDAAATRAGLPFPALIESQEAALGTALADIAAASLAYRSWKERR
jgi:hypothetical protein